MSEKSKKSSESVSSVQPSEVLKTSGVRRTFTAQFKEEALAMISREGLYLAVVEVLFTRKIVGWAVSPSMESRLVVDVLEMAVQREQPPAGLVAHADRGVQYAIDHYQQLLKIHEITCSMSRKGNCWDNAPMESFFATLKKELVHHEHYETRDQARQSPFEYIEVFYNRVRRHSALGCKSPSQFTEAL